MIKEMQLLEPQNPPVYRNCFEWLKNYCRVPKFQVLGFVLFKLFYLFKSIKGQTISKANCAVMNSPKN